MQRFIEPSRDLFDPLIDTEAEIQLEREGWIISGAAETLSDQKFMAQGWDGSFPLNPKDRQQGIDFITAYLYGGISKPGDTQKAAHLYINKMYSQLPRKVRVALEVVDEAIDEQRKAYEESTGYLTKQQKGLTDQLINQWVEFMPTDYSNFRDFYLFLTTEPYALIRQETVPFLRALEHERRAKQDSNDILSSLKKQTLERVYANPQEDLFEQSVKEIIEKEGSQTKHGNENISEWLQFVSYPSPDINPKAILERIKTSGIFPSSLRTPFTLFLDTQLSQQIALIKQALIPFREVNPLNLSLEIKTTQKIKKGTFQIVHEVKTHSQAPDVLEKPEYTLVLNGENQPSEESIRRFIEKTSSDLSPNDQRTRKDVETIILSLKEDPYGLGCSKLVDLSRPSAYSKRSVPRWHYRADKRPAVVLSNPESTGLRAIYYFDRRLAPRTVILEEIIPHDIFDRKYAS